MENESKIVGILKVYMEANPEERFQIMMRNYVDFPKEVNKAEREVVYKIKSEKERIRNQTREGLGIRVQENTLSDPTANEAISNLLLEEAFKTGNIDKSVLMGIDRATEIAEEIHMIRIMRMDYELLEGLMNNLPEKDSRIMIKHFVEKKYLKEIAIEEKRKYDAVKKRIKTLSRDLKEEIIVFLEMNYRREE